MKTALTLLGALFIALIYFMCQLGLKLAEPDMKTTATQTSTSTTPQGAKDPTMLITGKVSFEIAN